VREEFKNISYFLDTSVSFLVETSYSLMTLRLSALCENFFIQDIFPA